MLRFFSILKLELKIMTSGDYNVMYLHVIPRETTKKLHKEMNSKTLWINQNEILKYVK